MLTTNRAKQILESYGGNAQHWPEHEREDLLNSIAGNSALQQLQQDALQLDAQLHEITQITPFSEQQTVYLAAKIMAQIDQQPLLAKTQKATWMQRLSTLLLPVDQRQWVFASLLLVVCGLFLTGLPDLKPEQNALYLAQNDLDSELWLMEQMLDTQPDDDLLSYMAPELSEDDLNMDVL